MKRLTRFERRSNLTVYQTSKILKIFISAFFNSAIIVLLTSHLQFGGDWISVFWGPNGTISVMSISMMINMVLNPLTIYFNFEYFKKRFLRWKYK